MPTAFHFDIDDHEDGVAVRLHGDFDANGVLRLEPALDQVGRTAPPDQVVFDLRGLTFVDSAGLGLLVAADQRLRAAGVGTRFLRPPERVMRIFTLTALDEALPFEDG
jgi:anti-anti-sigma factor